MPGGLYVICTSPLVENYFRNKILPRNFLNKKGAIGLSSSAPCIVKLRIVD